MRKETARSQYDELFTAVSEETHGSELGFGFFLTQSGVTEEREFIAALLAGVNSAQAQHLFWDFMADRIQRYCQIEAESRQFGRGRFPPRSALPMVAEMFKDFRSGKAFGLSLPECNPVVDAGRGIKPERAK